MNVYSDPWVRVVTPSGTVRLESPQAILAGTDAIDIIAHDAPEVIGVYRFLVALKLAGKVKQEHFELFGSPGFMQTPLTIAPEGVQRLFIDIKRGTQSVHFDSHREVMHRVCPACVTYGIVRLSAYCTIGGRGSEGNKGFGATVNGGTPIYMLPHLQNVSATVDTCAAQITANGVPNWYQAEPADIDNVGAKSLLDHLTFMPRRFKLIAGPAGTCTRCGMQTDKTIEGMLFANGSDPGKESKIVDPFCLYRNGRSVSFYPDDGMGCYDWEQSLARMFADNKITKPVIKADQYRVFGIVADKAAIREFVSFNFRPKGQS